MLPFEEKIQIERNDSDSTDSTWNLDIQLFIVKINDAYKYNPMSGALKLLNFRSLNKFLLNYFKHFVANFNSNLNKLGSIFLPCL